MNKCKASEWVNIGEIMIHYYTNVVCRREVRGDKPVGSIRIRRRERREIHGPTKNG
jgi:hypothetical protein